MPATNIKRIKKNITESFVPQEDTIKFERIKQIMEQEKNMAAVRIAHEKRIIAMKENLQEELNTLEIRIATAKAELAELQLEREKEKIRL